MSTPLIRAAAQTLRTASPSAALDGVAAARSVSPGRAAAHPTTTITTTLTQQTTASASRSLTTSSVLLNKAVSETIKDTARAFDSTSSEGIEKMVELSENAMQRAKENILKAGPTEASNATASASTSSTSTVQGGLAEQIQHEAASAFEHAEEAAQDASTKTKETLSGLGFAATG